jgi:hypothetical protein
VLATGRIIIEETPLSEVNAQLPTDLKISSKRNHATDGTRHESYSPKRPWASCSNQRTTSVWSRPLPRENWAAAHSSRQELLKMA